MDKTFELLIQGVITQQYGVADHFLATDLVAGLRRRLRERYDAGLLDPAGVGKQALFKTKDFIRGDKIYWLEKSSAHPEEMAFLCILDDFIDYLNRTCFAGIGSAEFHYARYDQGAHYIRHMDQFQDDSGRLYSLVIYLNDAWQAEDGGALILYLPEGEVTILPVGGRAVFFKSDQVEHEVQPATRTRLSVTGWLKRHQPTPF